MVKPPKTMQPEGVDLEKAGRAAGKAFQDDSFHNYMARKISNQRLQFGLAICPDPREQQQQQQEQQKHPPKPPSSQSPSKKKNVTFAHGVKDNEKKNSIGDKKRKKKKTAIESILKKLKKRHGSTSKSRRQSRSLSSTAQDDTLLPLPQQELNQQQQSTDTSISMNPDDLVARALEREKKEAEEQQQQREKEREKEIQFDKDEDEEGEEEDGDTDTETPEKLQLSTTLRPSPQLRRDRPDLFFLGIVVMVNGYTDPDTETIQRLMHRHGGDLEKYETERITHIIAQNLSTAKANIYKGMRKPRPVVKPSWVVDCVKEGRLLAHGDYLIDEIKDNVVSLKSFFSTKSKSITTNTDDNQDANSTETDPELSEKIIATTGHKINTFQDHNICELSASKEQEQAHISSQDPTETMEQSEPRVSSGTAKVEVTESLFHNNTSELEADEEENYSDHEVGDGDDDYSMQLSQRDLQGDIPCNQEAFEEMNKAPDEMDQSTSNTLSESPRSCKGRTDSKYINGQIRTTGTDPNFLESFFHNSRLSFIGSYKQRTKESPKKKSHRTVTNETQRFVFHCDMDCFFAAVVLRNYPQYQNRPVAISHFGKPDGNEDPQANKNSSSECATCNYEARKFGIKKGMYLGKARQLCPSLVVLPYDFDGYNEEVSEKVTTILHRVALDYDGEVEQVSCDESYVELFFPIGDGLEDPYRRAGEVANALRREILQTTKCTATVGVGRNKFLAKLGTDRVKPNGSFVVRDYTELLRNLKLRDLHGVGYRFDRRLVEEGLVSVQDVWDLGDAGETALSRILGPGLGKKIVDFCNGQDDRAVKPVDRKTIGAECNYGVRFDGPYGVDYLIAGLAKEVEKRMKATKVRGSRVTIKVKQRKKGAPPPPKFLGHGSCHNLSKSMEVASGHTRDWKVIGRVATQLFTEVKIATEDIRGMGIVVSKLECADAEAGNGESRKNQSITKWFVHANETTKNQANLESNTDHEDSGPAISLVDGDDSTLLEHQQLCYSQINKSTLQGLSPEIQDDFTDLWPASSQENNLGEHSNDDDGDDGHEILNLSQDSVEVADKDPTDELEQNFCDVDLPPLSQIHMSQVAALPSTLREQITSKLAQHAKATGAEAAKPQNSLPSTNRSTPLKRQLGQDEGKARYRQISVKRLFRLAAVKSGQSELLSASELQHLPLEMQLQVANEDYSKLGTLSQRKPERRRRSSASPPKNTAARFRRQSDPIAQPRRLDSSELEGSAAQDLIERTASQGQLDQVQNVDADLDSESEAPVDKDSEDQPTDFYSNNVAPLDVFLDENPEANPEEVDQVMQFLCICIRERRLYDVVLLLRHIKNRRDHPWSNRAYPKILSEVDRTCEEVEGYRIDRQALNI